ncbi:MAG TPA: glutamate synthase large subunit, partial [Candidatus Dormibacteraeota bacterium]|nr:glutamate synthase large subunit [Candidatus Dormibacteraeota bacterium]
MSTSRGSSHAHSPDPRRAAWTGNLPAYRAACGMGFIATPGLPAGHRVVALGVEALARLVHRGGLDADGKSGDGAGLTIQIPQELVGGDVAIAALFEWDERARAVLASALEAEGLGTPAWRAVPVDPDALGASARASVPNIWHGLLQKPDLDPNQWEHKLFLARKRADRMAAEQGVRMYIPSCSSRTVVYKGLMAGTALAEFYLDLGNPDCKSQLSVFHQRYSTNTLPDWRLAQPFRLLAHNGEINTLSGNEAWMRARESELPEELLPVLWSDGSDSSKLDNTLELLVHRGYEVSEALMTLVPDNWEGRGDMAPHVRDFYRYQSTRFEPWDGPAALVFTDGIVAGVALDRNGLRPVRYQICSDGLVVAASEAGVVPLDPAQVIERGRLGPGQLLLVNVKDGDILRDGEAKERAAGRHEYGALADRLITPINQRYVDLDPLADLSLLQRTHGWGSEDEKMVVKVMADTALEPNWSMGDDTPIAPLGVTPRRVYGYIRQRFAQVTNPPIDSLRERFVMSLRVLLGPRGATLGPPDDSRRALDRRGPTAGGVEQPPLLELESPIIGSGELARILESATLLDATFGPSDTLASSLLRLRAEADDAPVGILVLSDRSTGRERLPIPMALAVGAVHESLIASGKRMQKDLVAIVGDAIDVHDMAVLIGCGASAIHPYLALAVAASDPERPAAEADHHYRKALDYGLLKVMAKMGISCVASYCAGHVFEAVGLGAEVMELCMPDVPSRVGGASLADLESEVRNRHTGAWDLNESPPDYGRVRFRKSGEFHSYNPRAWRSLQAAAQSGAREDYETFQRESHLEDHPTYLRDLMGFKEADPVPIDSVEPVEKVRSRFVATAMSLGALSPEAHETLAVAMNTSGGRSNSGEGGEDPDHYASSNGRRRDNKIKQVASARFGVTPTYLKRADELEIKIAQGSKPGEGGQLPAIKVNSVIARLRHAQPGMQLISPPPHHDIYSIEDLAQLIYDLKAVNPRAKVGVKLVSESGVGTIAAGVAKAKADYVLISGCDGGTGASPLSSIKNAGVPWEIGLAETQWVLVENNLRERLSVRTDGGLKSGRDIVVAAMLGAEEFGFGTGLLVAMGCDMARQCHLNTCPTGIATQREDLRAKFSGQPQHVVNYMTLIADEVRRILAHIGFKTLDEIIGRVELLETLPVVDGMPELDLSYLLRQPSNPDAPRRRLWERNGDSGGGTPPSGPIDNSCRTVGAGLRGEERSYTGSAGQSFGAWLDTGSHIALAGEANDYVGKGMGGGTIAI